MNDQCNSFEDEDLHRGTHPDAPSVRTMSSAELLQGKTEIFITHGEDVYRLRLTRNGKLILHK